MMQLDETIWRELPTDIMEHVLLFLPVPALCRFRSVCKQWNQLFCLSRFNDMRDPYAQREKYLIHVPLESCLDLNAKRWYTINRYDSPLEGVANEDRIWATDGGLVCELTAWRETNRANSIVLTDLIAMTRKILPTAPGRSVDDLIPMIDMVVDKLTHSYKVCVMNNKDGLGEPRMDIYQSSTGQWRSLRNPPARFRTRDVQSFAMFRGTIYTVFFLSGNRTSHLLSYSLEENRWTEVSVTIPRDTEYPRLFVSEDRLFLTGFYRQSLNRGSLRQLDICEILVVENACKLVLQLTKALLKKIFHDEPGQYLLIDSVQVLHISSVGDRTFILLMLGTSGRAVVYDLLRCMRVEAFPLNPYLEEYDPRPSDTRQWCDGRVMNLSLRNILSAEAN